MRRWLSEDEGFKADLAAARRATFEAGVGRIQALSEKAVGALEDLLDVRRHPAVRLGAARTILELGLSRYDAENILKKLAVIEQRQEGQDRRWRRS